MRLALLALCLALVPQEKKGLEIVWVDVEGGAATLVVTPEGESFLMDCGWPGMDGRDAKRIKKAAEAAGVKKIDHFLASHWHSDHYGGVKELVETIPVVRFYDHGFPGAEAKDIDPRHKEAYLRAAEGKRTVLKPGDTVPLKGASVKILAAHGIVEGEQAGAPQTRRCQANPEHPAKPDDTSDNARSLAYLLTFGEFNFYDGGDLTWNVEHKLVCPTNLIGAVDVLQSVHHGFNQSNNPALLAAAAPTVAVITCGAKKPGKPFSFQAIKAAPGLKDIFQVHRNVEVGAGDNTTPEFVANDDEKCQGEPVKLTVDPGGKSYTVEVPSKKTKRTYATK